MSHGDFKAFFAAACAGDVELVRHHLDAGVDVDFVHPEDDLSAWDDLLYPMYARRVQVHVHRALDEISFAQLSACQAQHLALPAGYPCAQVQRSAFDFTGRCVEVRTTRGDAHAFHYTVTIT